MSNKNPLVSIIIPAYNSEKYLRRCLNSVAKQTYNNIEVVVVNDGSTDGTEMVINKYLSTNSLKSKYIKQSNKGANIARKIGIKNSKGDYLMFLDSDDYIAPNTVEELVRIVEEDSLDLLKYSFINYDTGILEIKNKDDKKEAQKLLLTTMLLNNITNEIISRRIINLKDDVFSIKTSNGEDLLMNLSFFDRANKIRIINNKYYYYEKNHDSTTRTNDVSRLYSFMQESDKLRSPLLDYAKKWGLDSCDVINTINYRAIRGVLSRASSIICFGAKTEKNYSMIEDILDSIKNQGVDIDRLIKTKEHNIINKKIYLSINHRKYKTTRRLVNLKAFIKNVVR